MKHYFSAGMLPRPGPRARRPRSQPQGRGSCCCHGRRRWGKPFGKAAREWEEREWSFGKRGMEAQGKRWLVCVCVRFWALKKLCFCSRERMAACTFKGRGGKMNRGRRYQMRIHCVLLFHFLLPCQSDSIYHFLFFYYISLGRYDIIWYIWLV